MEKEIKLELATQASEHLTRYKATNKLITQYRDLKYTQKEDDKSVGNDVGVEIAFVGGQRELFFDQQFTEGVVSLLLDYQNRVASELKSSVEGL